MNRYSGFFVEQRFTAMEWSYDSDIKELMDSSDQLFDCKRVAYGGFRQLVHA